MTDVRAAALQRILRALGEGVTFDALAEELSPADLTALLLEVARRRSAVVSPAALLSRYREDAFVAPAAPDGRELVRLAHLLVGSLPEDVDVVGLSPVAPLGASSVVATVHQDKMVSTVRNTEVVSDPTNVLALEAAVRRSALLEEDPRDATQVRLAAVHRVLRGQRFATAGVSAALPRCWGWWQPAATAVAASSRRLASMARWADWQTPYSHWGCGHVEIGVTDLSVVLSTRWQKWDLRWHRDTGSP